MVSRLPLAQKEKRTFVARMSKYPEIVNLLFRAAIDQGMSRTSQIIAVGNGGNGLREELPSQFPGLQFILDRPHLKKHLYESAEAMGLRGDRKQDWVEEKLKIIDAGEVQNLGSSGLSLQNHLQKREQTLISRGIRVIFGNLRYRILAQQHVS